MSSARTGREWLEHLKKAATPSVLGWFFFIIIIIVAAPRCAYRGGSLFLRGLALPPLPPPLTGARALVPRRLIGHRASSIPGAPPIAGSGSGDLTPQRHFFHPH